MKKLDISHEILIIGLGSMGKRRTVPEELRINSIIGTH